MKKILALIVLLISAQIFGEAYSITKKPDVRMSEQQMKEEAREIEKAVKDIYRKDTIKKILEEEKNKTAGEYENEIIFEYFGELIGLVIESMKAEIKEISYVSPSLAELEIEVEIPRMENLDEKSIEKKLKDLFKKKSGYSFEDIEKNMSEKEIQRAYMSVIPYYGEILKGELKKIKEYKKETMTVPVKKINNIWKVEITGLF